jgi:hypothetical protein
VATNDKECDVQMDIGSKKSEVLMAAIMKILTEVAHGN